MPTARNNLMSPNRNRIAQMVRTRAKGSAKVPRIAKNDDAQRTAAQAQSKEDVDRLNSGAGFSQWPWIFCRHEFAATGGDLGTFRQYPQPSDPMLKKICKVAEAGGR